MIIIVLFEPFPSISSEVTDVGTLELLTLSIADVDIPSNGNMVASVLGWDKSGSILSAVLGNKVVKSSVFNVDKVFNLTASIVIRSVCSAPIDEFTNLLVNVVDRGVEISTASSGSSTIVGRFVLLSGLIGDKVA